MRLVGSWLSFLGCVAAPLVVSAQTPTTTVTPTFGGDCCVARPGEPGCEDPACTTCVCSVDDICCVVGWDDFCVATAEDNTKTGCAASCPCVSPTPTPQPTATPGGDCCAAHNGPGCDDGECQTCVCNDPVCCSDEWDEACVAKAIDDCPEECGCVAGTPTPTPTSGPTATPGGDCCEPHSGPSCDDSQCRGCVCAGDAACCNLTWDAFCVDRAQVECAADCACEPPADCCAVHESVGCDQLRCQDCVCEVDDFCCDTEAPGTWDSDCVGIAGTDCALECTCDTGAECCSAHEGVGCNVLSCQNCVCERDAFCCSLDPQNPGRWDQDCVDLASNPDACGAECPCGTADCCLPHGGVGCDEPQCESCVCGIDAPCCTEDGWDLTCAMEAMTECDSRCSCEVSGDGECCEPHDSPGCELSACEQCVCDEDEFCCDSSIGEWDSGCVELASRPDNCAAFCGCDPLSDCCFGRAEGAGCDQPACEECVCNVDDFCCSTDPKNPGFWDEGCSEIAKNPDECASSCSCGPLGTPTESPTPQPTPTVAPTETATSMETPSATHTSSVAPTFTDTATPVQTGTATSSPTGTPTNTQAPSVTASSTPAPTFTPTPVGCTGDCDTDNEVTTSEVVLLVRIGLGVAVLGECPGFDVGAGNSVTISDLISAVQALLFRCPPT